MGKTKLISVIYFHKKVSIHLHTISKNIANKVRKRDLKSQFSQPSALALGTRRMVLFYVVQCACLFIFCMATNPYFANT